MNKKVNGLQYITGNMLWTSTVLHRTYRRTLNIINIICWKTDLKSAYCYLTHDTFMQLFFRGCSVGSCIFLCLFLHCLILVCFFQYRFYVLISLSRCVGLSYFHYEVFGHRCSILYGGCKNSGRLLRWYLAGSRRECIQLELLYF